jgi:hypothetical protein
LRHPHVPVQIYTVNSQPHVSTKLFENGIFEFIIGICHVNMENNMVIGDYSL